MVRKKVKLAFIENDNARRITYKKRVKGLIKKTQELGVLCGVDICTVVYGPYVQAPAVWPSSEAEAKRIISAFRRRPEIDQSERQLNQEMYLKQSVTKAQEKLMKLQRRNREMEMDNLISDIFGAKLTLDQVSPCALEDLIFVIDEKLRSIQHKIRVCNSQLIINPSTNVGGKIGVSNDNQNAVMGQTPWEMLQAATSQITLDEGSFV